MHIRLEVGQAIKLLYETFAIERKKTDRKNQIYVYMSNMILTFKAKISPDLVLTHFLFFLAVFFLFIVKVLYN